MYQDVNIDVEEQDFDDIEKNMEEEQHFFEDDGLINNSKKYPIHIIIGFTMLILLLMGRPLFCKEKDYTIWNGKDIHMSQHFIDPYSITHMLHGLILYNSIKQCKVKEHANILITIIIACLWEIIENTQFIINMYRQDAIHVGYYGDSAINSLGDILSSICGWHLSKKIGTQKSITTFIICECVLLVWINDNLIRNVMIIISPFQILIFIIWYVKVYFEYMVFEKITNMVKTIYKKIKIE